MSKNLPYIIPASQSEVAPGFTNYQITYQFYQEVHTRLELQRHREWYYATAEQHRQDLKKMRGELNILQWFRRS